MANSYLIKFPTNCIQGQFVRRVKRFSVEVDYQNKRIWAHTNNTGAMFGLLRPGAPVLLSQANRPNRKLPYTLELIQSHGVWVGVNTLVPNRLLKQAWLNQIMPELNGYDVFHSEVKMGNCRIDARLSGTHGTLWVEAKNVTLAENDIAYFPDAVTKRGQNHINKLIALSKSGIRVALFFLIQRQDVKCFEPADFIDPDYAVFFYQAMKLGIEIWPYMADISEKGINIGKKLPVLPMNSNLF